MFPMTIKAIFYPDAIWQYEQGSFLKEAEWQSINQIIQLSPHIFLGTTKRLITNIMLLSKRELYAHVKFVG